MTIMINNNGRYIIKNRIKKNQAIVINRTGETYETKYGKLEIIDYINNNNVKIRFVKTGFTKWVKLVNITENKVKDYLHPTVCGIGCLGDDYDKIKKKYPKLYKKLNNVWASMLDRCYDINNSYYHRYGGAGVTVDNRWYNFCNFFHEAQTLPNWDEHNFVNPKTYDDKLKLDKDIIQQDIPLCKKVYSKSTCCWVKEIVNSQYRDYSGIIKGFIVISPDGVESIEYNMTKYAIAHGLDNRHISDCVNGKRRSHKGYRFKPLNK